MFGPEWIRSAIRKILYSLKQYSPKEIPVAWSHGPLKHLPLIALLQDSPRFWFDFARDGQNEDLFQFYDGPVKEVTENLRWLRTLLHDSEVIGLHPNLMHLCHDLFSFEILPGLPQE